MAAAPSAGAANPTGALDFKDLFSPDPSLQANLDTASSRLEQDTNKSADFSMQFAQAAQSGGDDNLQTPQNMMPEIMQQTPWLIGLTAVAGVLTKQSGLAMLSG